MGELNKDKAVGLLNRILEQELAGVVRAYPSLTIGPLLDTHRTDIGTILRESLASEGQALTLYKRGGQVGDARGVRAANGSGGGTTCRRRR